jgi:pimeloyl-ACP methyl ester carboxylesterase
LGIYRAAESAMAYLRDTLHVPRDRTVLEGWSLGTGTATELAARGEGSRLILISPYTSMTEMAGRTVPFLPVSWLVRDRFNTASKAPHVSVPTFIVHGEADPVIPVAMGRQLGALFPASTTLFVPGAGHNVAGSNAVMEKIVAFARDCPGATVHPPIVPPPE